MKKLLFICLLGCFVTTSQTIIAQSKATFYTTKGNFVVDLYDAMQPITSGNFKTLVNAKFYDGIIFHRVINNFMIQGGCPLGNGTGGPGYSIMDEFDPGATNIQKSISMANSGPNTGGSQFFINLVDNLYLNPQHPVFGIVSTNFSIVQSIGVVATNANDKPLVDVVMDSIRITAFPAALDDLVGEGDRLLMEIFPNPATSNSILSVQASKSQSVEMSIVDMFGKELFGGKKELKSGINSFAFSEMHIDNLSAGIYFIILKNSKSMTSHKLVMSR